MGNNNLLGDENRKNRNRQIEYDFIKALLIILVVWGHLCSYTSGSGYEKNHVTSIVRLFQMPMFIMISGIFQKEIYTYKQLLDRIKKIILSLAVPYVSWVIIGSVISFGATFLISGKNLLGGGIKDFLIMIYEEMNVLWFLGCLILCEVIYSILSLLSNKGFKCIIPASFVLAIIIPYQSFHLSFLWPFFIIGTYLDVVMAKLKSRNFVYRLSIILCLCVCVGAQYWPTKWTFYNASNYILSKGISQIANTGLFLFMRYFVYTLSTVSFFYLFLHLFDRMKYKLIDAIITITNIGTRTLCIFTVHIIVLYHVFYQAVNHYTSGKGILVGYSYTRYYLVCSVLCALTVIVCCKVNDVIANNRLLKRFLLGRS